MSGNTGLTNPAAVSARDEGTYTPTASTESIRKAIEWTLATAKNVTPGVAKKPPDRGIHQLMITKRPRG